MPERKSRLTLIFPDLIKVLELLFHDRGAVSVPLLFKRDIGALSKSAPYFTQLMVRFLLIFILSLGVYVIEAIAFHKTKSDRRLPHGATLVELSFDLCSLCTVDFRPRYITRLLMV